MARIVRFMDFGKEVEGWGAGFRIDEKGCHPWILGRTGNGEEAGQISIDSGSRVMG